MTPIERVSEKSQALAILGLSTQCSKEDLRIAFHQRAKETHPDQANGDADKFAEVTSAYQFLKENAETLGIFDRPRLRKTRVSRPIVKPSEIEFSDEIIAECEELLGDNADTAQHVATGLYRVGRNATFIVPNRAEKGANMVVVPTGELVDKRHAHPVALVVESRSIEGCTFKVPEEICADNFPGARRVQIRFASN